jgi:hypothetical protein
LELFVDGQPSQVPEGVGPTLGDLLAVLRDGAGADSRAITTVEIDGEELMPAAEEQALSRAYAELGKLEIVTAPAAEWGRHGLGEAASALGQMADEFRQIADLLRAGDRPQSVERFGGAIAVYGQLITALVNAAALAGVAPPEGFEQCVGSVTEAMKEIAPALQAEDAVEAADLAEYELAARLEELGEMVKVMAGN